MDGRIVGVVWEFLSDLSPTTKAIFSDFPSLLRVEIEEDLAERLARCQEEIRLKISQMQFVEAQEPPRRKYVIPSYKIVPSIEPIAPYLDVEFLPSVEQKRPIKMGLLLFLRRKIWLLSLRWSLRSCYKRRKR